MKGTSWVDFPNVNLSGKELDKIIASNNPVDRRLLNLYKASNTLRMKSWNCRIKPLFEYSDENTQSERTQSKYAPINK